MSNNPPSTFASVVDWKFTLVEQGQVTRYGVLVQSFYKQYLPGGVEVPVVYPVKKIDPRVYALAHRQYLSRLKQS